MDIKQLKSYLDVLTNSLKNEDKVSLTTRLKSLSSAFPFSEYEFMLTFLFAKDVINFEDYDILRANYVSSNRNLELYGLAPRIFGEIWAESHIIDLDKRIKKGSKSLDSEYDGQYDLWMEGIKIEVKSSRAINTKQRGSLVSKAVHSNTEEPFWMNFQQLKLNISDVFIFLGVWPNEIIYWVLSNEEVKSNEYISHQHRGGIEYQIGITNKNIINFSKYIINPKDIVDIIIKKKKL